MIKDLRWSFTIPSEDFGALILLFVRTEPLETDGESPLTAPESCPAAKLSKMKWG